MGQHIMIPLGRLCTPYETGRHNPGLLAGHSNKKIDLDGRSNGGAPSSLLPH